ncbi:hypothetical protein ARSEF4850_008818 [Beauveria asiatica]
MSYSRLCPVVSNFIPRVGAAARDEQRCALSSRLAYAQRNQPPGPRLAPFCEYCPCTGEQPCNRCEQRGEVCEYDRRERVSKSELRAEIGRLRQRKEDDMSQRAQEQGSSATTSDNAALQGWVDSVRSTHLENGSFVLPGDGDPFSSVLAPGGTPLAAPPSQTSTSAGTLSCFDQLRSWRSCHPTLQQRNASKSSSSPPSSRALSLPLAPLDAYTTLAQKDRWTQVGWTCAQIRHLFDVLCTWDCVFFCILRKNEFVQDYDAGSSQFCSSALVHALLALSTRLVNETEDQLSILPSGWLGSKYFLCKAKALLREQGSVQSLPDIQSLGILALYYLRCGHESEARELAELCSARIRSLCLRECGVSELDEQYIKVRATTYCGSISLLRSKYNAASMYYHFCTLCAFRSLVGSDFASSEVQPLEICVQAVKSILTLSQSYDDLFTLRRVPALFPYFVCASGLFALAIEDSRAEMDFVDLRPRAANSPQQPHLSYLQGAAFFPPETTAPSGIKVSMVVEAQRLLSKMGASHPAAAIAKEKLIESKNRAAVRRSWV